METINWNDFDKVAIYAGTIIEVQDFPKAHKPAYKLWIDLGAEIGIKTSSAQITARYTISELIGLQVICVVNFPKKQIADFRSEVLTTGFVLPGGQVILATPHRTVPNGTRLS